MNSTTTRYYGRKLCDLTEKQLGIRITSAVIEKRKGAPVKVTRIKHGKKHD